MARTVKEQEYAGKRNGILDAVQRPVYSKGYKRMTIQDILNDQKNIFSVLKIRLMARIIDEQEHTVDLVLASYRRVQGQACLSRQTRLKKVDFMTANLGIKTFDPLTASEPTFNMELVRPGRIA